MGLPEPGPPPIAHNQSSQLYNKSLLSVEPDALVLGDDHYGDPEYDGARKNLRVSPSEIEIVVRGRKDEDGEDLPDRFFRIDHEDGTCHVGEDERGVTVDDEGIYIEDEETSVAVLADRVEVEVGSAVLKVEDGKVAGSVGGQAFEVDGDGVRLEANGVTMGLDGAGVPFLKKGDLDLFKEFQQFATTLGGSTDVATQDASMALQTAFVAFGIPVPIP